MHSVASFLFSDFVSILFISPNIQFIISKLYITTGVVRLLIAITIFEIQLCS